MGKFYLIHHSRALDEILEKGAIVPPNQLSKEDQSKFMMHYKGFKKFMRNKVFTSLIYEAKNIPKASLKPRTFVLNAEIAKKSSHFCANWNFGLFSEDICIKNSKNDDTHFNDILASWMELHLKCVIDGSAPVLFENEVVFENMSIDISKPENLEYIIVDRKKLTYYQNKYPQYKFVVIDT